MIAKQLFRYALFFLFLVSCDDLPNRQVSGAKYASLDDPSSDTTDVRLSRPSPPLVLRDTVDAIPFEVTYGAPSVRDRIVFGKLVPYGEIWRTGANEATTLSMPDTLLLENQKLAPGQYAIFTVPRKNQWDVLINAEYDQWGAYNYDPEKDVLRLQVTPEETDVHQEQMTFRLEGNKLVLHWDNLRVPISLRTPR
jgi:hypothetical protein